MRWKEGRGAAKETVMAGPCRSTKDWTRRNKVSPAVKALLYLPSPFFSSIFPFFFSLDVI